ncbi:MAG: hypothetical protein C0483_01430 [Pirellula sp.]|nr:hypothetical protein [Pirellula sp.]
MSFFIRQAVLVLALGCLVSQRTFAQNIVPSGATGTAAPAARQSLKFGADYQLASWVATDLYVAQSLGQIALQKGTDSIRPRAERAIAMRAKRVESLIPFIGDNQQATPSATSATVPITGGTGPIVSTSTGPAFDLVSLKRALAEETLATMRKHWSALSDEEFDRTYSEWEARNERCDFETLSVFREHASPALRQVFDAILAETSSHALEVASPLR